MSDSKTAILDFKTAGFNHSPTPPFPILTGNPLPSNNEVWAPAQAYISGCQSGVINISIVLVVDRLALYHEVLLRTIYEDIWAKATVIRS